MRRTIDKQTAIDKQRATRKCWINKNESEATHISLEPTGHGSSYRRGACAAIGKAQTMNNLQTTTLIKESTLFSLSSFTGTNLESTGEDFTQKMRVTYASALNNERTNNNQYRTH